MPASCSMGRPKRVQKHPRQKDASWDAVATWYDGMVGGSGSRYHRFVALPTTLELLEPQAGERILDLGAGQGVLAPSISKTGATYTGVDLSSRLVKHARRRHGARGSFLVGDVRRLQELRGVDAGSFDAVGLLHFSGQALAYHLPRWVASSSRTRLG